MIPNQWYVLMESKQVKEHPVGVTRMGEKLVFWRDQDGRVGCLHDRCAHRLVALSKGQVVGGRVQCPFHGFVYSTDGQCVHIPANGRAGVVPKSLRVRKYSTHEEHGFIWVWWGDTPPEDLKPPRYFDDIDPDMAHASAYDPWQAHYSRVIENQLDVVHLPFVHHNTIGRGNRTVVDGPGLEWVDDNMFFVYVYNREDDGTPPRKSREVPTPDPRGFKLEFIFPNLWQNRISDNVRIVAAFVPVDNVRTLLYLRFYQSFFKLPILKGLIARLAMPFNLLIAHQDRRVVETHCPQRSGLKSGEKLIQGDRPIIEYRRRRQELIDLSRLAEGDAPDDGLKL